jgi:hypothetical protein
MRNAFVLLLLAADFALAQPTRPEVFGFVGMGRTGGDEGSLGSGLAAGGAVTIPFVSRWALDFDVTHLRSKRDFAGPFRWESHRTHFSPAVQYRRGSERTYGFAAFGVGGTAGTTHGGWHLHGKVGIVTALTEQLLLRAEFFSVFRYVLPDAGVKAGLGYRF